VSEPQVPQGTPTSGVPVCYRHTDRETYVRCSRCDRPICPDCMTTASVGFQCPECVAAGNAGQRPARTVFGGRVQQRPAFVTATIIGVCVAVYLVQISVPTFTARFWLLGTEVAGGQTYRLVTAAFLHGGLTHLLFNMWALWLFGQAVESHLGRARFVTVYLVSLVAGTTASYVFNSPETPSLGASGAIFGIVGAMIVLGRRMRMPLGWVVGFAVINIVFTVAVSNVDWHAHLGGLVGGGIVTAAMVYAPPAQRVLAWVLSTVVVVAALGAVVAWRTQQIRENPRYSALYQQGWNGELPSAPQRPFP
jgi:membrane associated rhomboid family serine protease